ncbi:class-II fumarase/aspartase family protein [Falsirhodobacter xinxiangensis]|uniref:class-II fumarase/aspartase family protein n=1 Tax=Falsirhodobacter xinxiangensis TaxID=2530049 RepID=UPI0010AA02BF|nr:adenylosuccinate lyase family protein [Rhodobacter xinxiangensis]
MPAHPADSAIYRGLLGDEETARLFSDSSEIRAMLLVWGALAKAQGDLGVIPADAAAFIERSTREAVIDPLGLADATAVNGVPVPALVAAFRKAMEAPDLSQYLHWGTTSQDIMDTALALRLRRVMALWDDRLGALIASLARLADAHADLPMAARTYGQAATPTTFGAVVAGWGHPLLRHRQRLSELRSGLAVSLSGAAGTLSAMAEGPKVRAAMAASLGLRDPEHSWHSDRSPIVDLAAWMAAVTASLGKIGQDLILSAQTGISEVAVEGAGASSTMPQKQNPVAPSVLVALARLVAAGSGAVTGAAVHAQQRDGSAWFVEWLTLPSMAIATGRSLALARDVADRVRPDASAMQRGLSQDCGLIMAEAASFVLARQLGRVEAQASVKTLSKEALALGLPLTDLLARDFPQTDWSAALGGSMSGTAADDARAFAALARTG